MPNSTTVNSKKNKTNSRKNKIYEKHLKTMRCFFLLDVKFNANV